MSAATVVSPPRIGKGDFLLLEDLSELLGLSPKTIKRMHKEYGFPLRRLVPNGRGYVFWSEVEAWLKSCQQDKS